MPPRFLRGCWAWLAQYIYKTSPAEVAVFSAAITVSASPLAPRAYSSATYTGEATSYGGNVAGGTCGFYGYTIPSNLLGVALTDAMWDSAAHCGACISVKGPSGNSITAMVVDQCPGCGINHLDLFQNAFTQLAPLSKGIIPVSWKFVPCGITSPISLKSKSGSSQWWFSMQVMNSNLPVTTLEVSTDGSKTWKPTTRRFYNFFENPSGFGNYAIDVRITSITGTQIIMKNVSYASDAITKGTTNFAN